MTDFSLLCRFYGIIEPVAEYRFEETRRWRFDFAWPNRMVAVELHGGAFTAGRHVRGAGFVRDCEKMRVAAALGWRVLPIATGELEGRTAAVMSAVQVALGMEPVAADWKAMGKMRRRRSTARRQK